MKVFLVYKEDYPWDVRVEKLALALSEAGHAVTVIANNHNKLAESDTQGNINIKRLPQIKWLPTRILKLIFMPVWFNFFWLNTLLKQSKGSSQAVFLIRDLPLLKAGLLCAKLRSGNVILDMAEVYPEMYASSQQFSNKSIFQRILKSPYLAQRYENATLPDADHILVMIEESRDRLLKKKLDENKISIVSNTPPINKYLGKTHIHKGSKLHIVYVGFLTRLRGLDLLIQGVNEFLNLGYDKSEIQVDLIGKGAERDSLIKLIHDLNLDECITVHGWLAQDRVDELLANANVGALTYRVCGHWNHTIPNKIFDYMLAGLPVLTTPVIPICRIIESTNCGLICDDNKPDFTIAKNLEKLRDPAFRKKLGTNGQNAVLERYNWEKDKNVLLSVFEALEADISASGTSQTSESSASQ
ncbi:glycosyltransferase WbuB [Marinobacter halodurans]|uniref:Glycosyltransferase WbuB n=1 Tax=Marinobacter halodurans TaxID=2528979 RepID=A0ABY1ZGU5_9GAMM|nr:glycosyltransferase family 4 protein [Marinobacter halodurans]TBW51583.1 glycosyltransferase WbuB [Marinobacter halodurans]